MSLKIKLRAPEPSDLDFMLRMENDPSLWECGDQDVPFSRHTMAKYLDNYVADILGERQLRLVVDNDGRAVGMVDFFDYDPVNRRASVGIVVTSEFRRQGIATEALRQLTSYAEKRLALHHLWAITAVENTASVNAFVSAGYSIVGTLPDWLSRGERYQSAYLLRKVISVGEM